MLVLALLACTGAPPADTDPEGEDSDVPLPPITFTAVGFNTESGGSLPSRVADETVAFIDGASLWGFSEVQDEAAAELYAAAAADSPDQEFRTIVGTTGWTDRLVLAWDDARFSLEDEEELDWINVGDTARAPLVARATHRESGLQFLFMVNHLWRTDNDARHEQAELLNEWAREQTLPILAVGDYNFDWDVPSDGEDYQDAGYALMTKDGVWSWIRPDPIIASQCSFSYDSVLDFTFVAGAAQDWEGTAEIVEPDRHYCDDDEDERSDHRPVVATFTIPR